MRYLLIATALMLGACATPKSDDYIVYKSAEKQIEFETVNVSLNTDVNIDFRGVYEAKEGPEMGSVIYMADAGLVGVIAQVAVHAAASSGAQDNQLSELQIEANKILEPYKEILAGLRQDFLFHEDKRYTFDSNVETGILMDSYPIYYMSQDQKTVVLKNVLRAKVSSEKNPFYQNIVEIVSQTIKAEDLTDYYSSNSGDNLKYVIKNLYQKSLSLAYADAQGRLVNKASRAKSYRFNLGKKKRFERGQSLLVGCNTETIRNLRGWVIQFPKEAETECNS